MGGGSFRRVRHPNLSLAAITLLDEAVGPVADRALGHPERRFKLRLLWGIHLTEIAREGARRMLAVAMGVEADAFVAQHSGVALPDGRQRVVRHGHGPMREDPDRGRPRRCSGRRCATDPRRRDRPAAEIVERLRQVLVEQADPRLDPGVKQPIDQPVVNARPGSLAPPRPRGSTRGHATEKR